MKIVSWNVNGIKSCLKKGLQEFVQSEKAGMYCFQEVKTSPKDLEKIEFKNYFQYWLTGKKNGYSGLLVLSRKKPLKVINGIKVQAIDDEARVLTLEFKEFFLLNVYFPHTQRELKRLKFKLDFNKKFEAFCEKLSQKKPLVLAGDFNVAHEEIDLKNPKQNEKNAGFTVEERNWFSHFLKLGFVDSFRLFCSEGGHYTWWTWRNNARQRNIGWRVDYFVTSEKLKAKLKKSVILDKVMGSDHCPIELELKI